VLSIAMKRFCVHVWQPSVFSLGPIIWADELVLGRHRGCFNLSLTSISQLSAKCALSMTGTCGCANAWKHVGASASMFFCDIMTVTIRPGFWKSRLRLCCADFQWDFCLSHMNAL
jgi:hypothetical protein